MNRNRTLYLGGLLGRLIRPEVTRTVPSTQEDVNSVLSSAEQEARPAHFAPLTQSCSLVSPLPTSISKDSASIHICMAWESINIWARGHSLNGVRNTREITKDEACHFQVPPSSSCPRRCEIKFSFQESSLSGPQHALNIWHFKMASAKIFSWTCRLRWASNEKCY